MTEKIYLEDKILAIIIRASFEKSGVEFFTPDSFSQQLGYMNRKAGYVIAPHTHREVKRTVLLSQEVLLIRSGKVKVNLFDDNGAYHDSRILSQGDVIMLASGGHGFEILEDAEMIEIKQGPYQGEEGKVSLQDPTTVNT